MKKLKNHSFNKLRNLGDRGTAMLEFTLALPFLLFLGLGGLEIVNYVIVQMQLNRIAVMTADNASRLRSQMSESYINQLFVGVQKAGNDINFKQNGKVILSSIQNNSANSGQWIRWQRCFGDLTFNSAYGAEGKGQNDTTLPNIDGLTAQAGSAIMYVEVRYNYQPLFTGMFFTLPAMTRKAAFIVRQRTDFSIAGSSPSRC